jgi:hypothetical protein
VCVCVCVCGGGGGGGGVSVCVCGWVCVVNPLFKQLTILGALR